jgi:hypothetical protein
MRLGEEAFFTLYRRGEILHFTNGLAKITYQKEEQERFIQSSLSGTPFYTRGNNTM